MKVTFNWLKEFVNVKLSPEVLAERLTMAGLSVASLERAGDDWVYDIEVTSNRPDWLSVRGIAREVAAITGAKVRSAEGRKVKKDHRLSSIVYRPSFSVSIADSKDCGLYCGALISGVTVGPSPKNIVARLEALGVRPVNNVVDITNICMLEYGQPLHAFDFDKLPCSKTSSGQTAIVVRRAWAGEKIVLIDGTEKTLTKDILVIADAERPVAVAGIMGGRDTEVTLATKNIFLESAVFDPVIVRRGARLLGIATDASYRFERGVDRASTKIAAERAAAMVIEQCGGSLQAMKAQGHGVAQKKKRIVFRLAEAEKTLCLRLSLAKTKNILAHLGFGVRVKKGGVLDVMVPEARRDVYGEEDIVEEVARSVGYDLIPLTSPQIKPFAYEPPAVGRVESVVKDVLVGAGYKEVVTYSLIGEEDYTKSLISGKEEALSLVNPLSVDAKILRTTLVPSLLGCVAYNFNQGNKDFEIFEAAHVFAAGCERVSLGIVLAGDSRRTWERESKPYTLFDLKGALESIAEKLQISDCAFSSAQKDLFAPSTGGEIFVAGKACGVLGQLSETVRRNWAIKAKSEIFVAEICLETLAQHVRFAKQFRPILATPCVYRDISLVAGASATFKKIESVVRENASSYLKSIRLADSYQGKEIPKGSIGLTISLEYGVAGKTLTDQDVESVHRNVLDALVNKLGIILR